MFHSPRRPGVAWLVVCALATAAGAAQAQKPASKPKGQSATSVRFIEAPSSESAAARRARLKQECKGRPNAGACLGLTGR